MLSTFLVELSIMERFNMRYSQKNIPIPNEKTVQNATYI